MSNFVKYIVAKTYKPLLVKYLSQTRWYSFENIHLEIPPEVFHPGFFHSTKFLLQYLSRLPLSEKIVLELGAGSGLISMCACKKGSVVTASDINPIAIKYLQTNALHNDVAPTIILSDLFQNIPQQQFDYILINPPYYKRAPTSYAAYAWYCGEEGEYFQNLFRQLKNYISAQSVVLMVLCDGCDLEMINGFARKNGYRLQQTAVKKTILETNYIFKIEQAQYAIQRHLN